MNKLLSVLILAAATALSQDATGKWRGSLDVGDGEPRPAFMMLKQDGAKLTGTAGPDESEQNAISDGKVEAGRLTFVVPERSMKFDLKVESDRITGEVSRERNGVQQKATITLQREK